MALKRVIPCLDVDAGRVVKGTNFVGLRDAGDPVELARLYDAEGADELTFLDISASHEGRSTTMATPSSSLLAVTSSATAFVSEPAFPMATPSPAQVSIS